MTVNSVVVNGQPATFKFVQPTYPGDPNGQDDPDPLAHQASQVNPVGGPQNNPHPPACTPQVTGDDVQRAERRAVPGEQARDHAVHADPGRHRLHGHGLLHRPPGRAHRRRRHDRGLVPQRHPGRRRRLRHDRAGRHRGLDAAQRPSDAPSRPTTSTTPSTPAGPRSPTASCLFHRAQPAGRQLPRRLDDLALALAGADRELPGREQRRSVRPDLA